MVVTASPAFQRRHPVSAKWRGVLGIGKLHHLLDVRRNHR